MGTGMEILGWRSCVDRLTMTRKNVMHWHFSMGRQLSFSLLYSAGNKIEDLEMINFFFLTTIGLHSCESGICIDKPHIVLISPGMLETLKKATHRMEQPKSF